MKSPIVATLLISILITFMLSITGCASTTYNEEISYSEDWQVFINGKEVPIYNARVTYDGPASFCSFDLDGETVVSVKTARDSKDFIIRPVSKSPIGTAKSPGEYEFIIASPGQYSLEIGPWPYKPLLLFANPPDTPPDKKSKDVVYYEPGYHEVTVSSLTRPGQTVYLEEGAYLKAVLGEDEIPLNDSDWAGMKIYSPAFSIIDTNNCTIRGRGIIDMSGLPWHSRLGIAVVRSQNILIEGITIIDSPHWTIVTDNSSDVVIDNIKLIGYRENSDGIDIVNSQAVTVQNSFVRTGDDGIVVKTFPNGDDSQDILVTGCVLWNEKVRALGITNEAARPIHDVVFSDIDIIHDRATGFDQAWTLAVWINDTGPVYNILFEDIRCEYVEDQFIEVGLQKDDRWSQTGSLGSIYNIKFKDITVFDGNPGKYIQIISPNEDSYVSQVEFENVRVGKELLASPDNSKIYISEFSKDISF